MNRRLVFGFAVLMLALPVIRAQPPVPRDTVFTVNSTADKADLAIDGLCKADNNKCTLRAALMEANGLGSGITVVLPAGTFKLTRDTVEPDTAENGDLDVTGSVTITGAGMDKTVIDASAFSTPAAAIHISSGSSAVTLSGLTVTGGTDSGIRIDNPILGATTQATTLTGVRLHGNSGSNGGGVFCQCKTLTIGDSLIDGNDAAADGGGIYANDSTLTVNHTRIENNSAQGSGGGISGFSYVNVSDSAILSNTAADGGGLYVVKYDMFIDHSEIAYNHAVAGSVRVGGDGGGVIFAATYGLVSDTYIHHNTADGNGGGLYLQYGGQEFDRVSVTDNTAAGFGGGAYVNAANGIFYNLTVSGNTALDGAGVYATASGATSSAHTHVTSSTIAYNVPLSPARDAAGGIYAAVMTLSLNDSILSDNGGDQCAGTPVSADYNIIRVNSCGMTLGANDIVSDPQLSPLQFDGPDGFLPVHEPSYIAGPAYGTGDNVSCPPTDARGLTRPLTVQDRCDIGAVEVTAGYQLLVNGSFEADADANKIPDSWSPVFLSGDKRKCNKPEKTVSFAGNCAMAFKNPAGKLRQTLTALPNGQTTLGAYVSTNVLTPVVVILAKFSGADDSKTKLKLKTTGKTSGYQVFTASTVLNAPVSGKVMVKFVSPTGKMSIDGAWLFTTGSVGSPRGIVPPPVAPTGFRTP